MRHLTRVAGLLAGLAVAVTAGAFPLTYDESITGDLDFSSPPLAFDAGTNVINGRSAFFHDPIGPTDRTDSDSFRFTLPVGTWRVHTSYAFTLSNSGTTFAEATYRLEMPPGPILGSTTINLFGASPVPLLQGLQALTEGTYSFTQDAACSCNEGQGWQSSYTLIFQVDPIPEPESFFWALVAAGATIARVRRTARQVSPCHIGPRLEATSDKGPS